jgi:heme/copper-type cytochrome/quinol oxidase subunit 2
VTALLLGLCSCSTSQVLLFHPVGAVAGAEWRFTLIDVGIMCLLIVPVAVMTGVFVWRYRRSAGHVGRAAGAGLFARVLFVREHVSGESG